MNTLTKNIDVIKKTFNIKADLVQIMQDLIPTRKQTDFVNQAIEKSILEMQHSQLKQQAKEVLFSLRKIRQQNKSEKSAVEIVSDLRHNMT